MESSVLIDYSSQIGFVKPLPTHRNYVPKILFIIPKNVYTTLSAISSNTSRLQFITSPQFTYTRSYLIYFNDKKNIAVLPNNIVPHLAVVIEEFKKISSVILLWIPLDLSETSFINNLQSVIKEGFGHPYMTINNPAIVETSSTGSPNPPILALIYPAGGLSLQTILNKALHALQQYRQASSQSCFLYAQFSPSALKYLQQMSKMGKNCEYTGELVVGQVNRSTTGHFIYTINVDKGSVSAGSEEDVNVAGTRYNFHSHPEEAYIRHSVEKAWPSLTDYLGYHKLGSDTIFHCVATLEGVYIMSFSSYWGPRLNKLETSFIKKHFDIDGSEPYSPSQYVKKVNSILKNGHPVFIVYYMPWKEANKPFKIHFSPIDKISCIPTQQGMEYFSKIHK